MKLETAVAVVVLLGGAPGCFSTGVYRTARTLPKGEGDFSMGFNVVRLSMENPLKDTTAKKETGGDVLTFVYPNLVPELSYHYGAVDNLEVGGRLVLTAGLIELDTKYRLLGDDNSRTHVALGGAVGYHALGLVEGVQATVPLIFTYDFTDGISLNLGGFGSYSHYGSTNKTSGSSDPDLSGDTVTGGGSVGIQFRTNTSFHFMPSVEVQRALSHQGDLSDLPKYTAVLFSVTMGWGPNRQLNRMEKTLDRIEQKVDRLQPPQPSQPPQ